ncbi:MAG: thioredoxin [Candidatus Sumerlaeia bacterium]
MASENVHEFTDENFEAEVVKADMPVLVDFWAEWCGPCRMITPIIEEIASDMEGKLKVGKVDIDSNSEIAMKFGIESIPTLMLFADGEVKEVMMGAQPKNQIVSKLTPHISGS